MRRETNGYRAGIDRTFSRDFALFLGRRIGGRFENVTVGEDGFLVYTELPDGEAAPRPLLYLPWGADVALAEAFAEQVPDAEWKARAEERQVALDREAARVDRILGGNQ